MDSIIIKYGYHNNLIVVYHLKKAYKIQPICTIDAETTQGVMHKKYVKTFTNEFYNRKITLSKYAIAGLYLISLVTV